MKHILQVQKKKEVLSLITNIAFTNVPCWYDASRRDLRMDLIVPKHRAGHAPCPAVVWVCGGAYMVVDRSVWLPELMRFARRGYVVASIEYRTSNEAQFPAQLIDVKSAIRYLRAHAEDYCIDPGRIFIMGESAGGTMACLSGTTAGKKEYEQGDFLEYDSSVQGVVDFYGIADLVENSCHAGGNVPAWTMDAFLGMPASKQAEEASAIRHIDDRTPPFMILHGTADPLIPPEQSQLLYDTLQRYGISSEYIEIPGATHGDDAFFEDEIVERILSFLESIGD